MPAVRLSMRKIREMLRLRWGLNRSLRETARSCGVGATTVHDVLVRATAAGLTWPVPDELDDAALEARLYPPVTTSREQARPDFAVIYRELKQRGVTLELLWQEYRQQHPADGYGYSRFCDLYRAWRAQLTEPEAGSDALAVRTTAVLTPNKRQYILNRVKQFVTNAGFADLLTVFATVDGEQFTTFLVERSIPGVSTGPEEQKMGIKGSSTRQLVLDNARVPVANVLGEVGRGHKIAFNILNIGRLKLGCGAVGVAKECLTAAVQYAAERKQFGQPIASYGMIQRKIAGVAVRIYVADSMGYCTAGLMDDAIARLDHTASDYDRRIIEDAIEEFTAEDSIIKVFGTKTLDMVSDEALQVFGGYGFTAEYPVERRYRDSRINRIFEGTNEINRLIVPATLIKRVTQGKLPLLDFMTQVREELRDETKRPRPGSGPLASEAHATEMSKRLVAYTAKLLLERELSSLKTKQQYLEILSNMLIDVYAMDSTVARTLKLIRVKGESAVGPQMDMTRIFAASAHERVADGAHRLVANEVAAEELHQRFSEINALSAFLPICTIHLKTQVAEYVVATRG